MPAAPRDIVIQILYLPYLLAGAGVLCAEVVLQRRSRSTIARLLGLVMGGLCGFCTLLPPYLVLREAGAYYPYYSQGRFGIELGSPADRIPGAGWLYLATLATYRPIDEWLCNRFLPVPSGG